MPVRRLRRAVVALSPFRRQEPSGAPALRREPVRRLLRLDGPAGQRHEVRPLRALLSRRLAEEGRDLPADLVFEGSKKRRLMPDTARLRCAVAAWSSTTAELRSPSTPALAIAMALPISSVVGSRPSSPSSASDPST